MVFDSRSMARVLTAIFAILSVCSPAPAHTDISAEQAHAMIATQDDLVVLDVREDGEFCGSAEHIANAANLPWISGVLQARFAELPTDVDIIVVCASGGRSHLAATLLDDEGFGNVYDMLGGMNAWQWETEPCDPKPVLRISRTVTGAEIDWTPVHGPQDYDLLCGQVEQIVATEEQIDLGPTDCLLDDSPFTYFGDASSSFGVLFYLARQSREQSWGTSSGDLRRQSPSASCD